MRALRVVVIAFLTAIAGAVLSVVASQYLTELYHVSNFEGGRGMLIFFALAPLGLTVGFIIGLIVALRQRGTGFGGFAEAQGIALGIAIGLAAIVSGILYLGADHPPKLDGKRLALEFELKIPPALKLPVQQSEQTLHAGLYANNRDNRYALLNYDKSATRDGYVFVPGKASLLSQTFNRDLLVSIEGEGGGGQFIKLKLRAKPRKEDEAWSERVMVRNALILVRCRTRKESRCVSGCNRRNSCGERPDIAPTRSGRSRPSNLFSKHETLLQALSFFCAATLQDPEASTKARYS